ncbi:MAG: 3-isopropylmalate dehydratase small subunit [Elusimicrobiota bacterium]|jgi:3-isopropylmalate/(R)-2-methylmalate dehydratase small subunit|nr:3-isopropylmalate dehydratase small subunit [Elusimicrobiota bacterium]
MALEGNVHRFKKPDGNDNDINTDYIISGRYKFQCEDYNELAKHIMEDLDANFYTKISKGDFIVAGENFGCGSSREQAPIVIIHSGISAVIAKSFARIFFRNAFNKGLPLIECDTDKIDAGDKLRLDLENGILKNTTKNQEIKFKPIPKLMLKLLNDGGLIEHFKKNKGFFNICE